MRGGMHGGVRVYLQRGGAQRVHDGLQITTDCKYKSWAGVGDCIGCVAGKYLSTEGNDEDTIALFPHPTFHDRRRRAQDRRDAATGEECDDGNSQDGRSYEPSAMSLEIVDAAGSILHAVTPSAPSCIP